MPAGLTESDQMFSVRETPWHRQGIVLDRPPNGIDEALTLAGLEWKVVSNAVYRQKIMTAGYPTREMIRDAVADALGLPGYGAPVAAEKALAAIETIIPGCFTEQQLRGRYEGIDGFKANVREDTDEVLGVVSGGFQIIDNRDCFRFLDSLINSDLLFETAGSLGGGRRVFVTCRLPNWIEIAGDTVGTYVYVANGHDGSMSFTVSPTSIRIVCQNTFNAAIARTEGTAWRFRHTGGVVDRAYEARIALGMTLSFERQFKEMGDKLGTEPISDQRFERKVLRELFKSEPTMGKIALGNRDKAVGTVLDIFHGRGPAGDTTGNAPGTKWCALNAVGEYADYCRRYTVKTSQVQRSFEDDWMKRKAFALVVAA